jgi:NADPH-dependent ferric siderophore reductase
MHRFLVGGTVEEVENVTPRARRIRIVGAPLRDLDWLPGQHVRVLVGELGSARAWATGLRDLLRTYSVWEYAPDGVLDLCVLDHRDPGPGARWARSVAPGARVSLTRPEGRLVPDLGAPYHLFVGDDTASVAFGAMLRALPAAALVHGAVQATGAADRLPLPRSDELSWVYHDPATADVDPDVLLAAVRGLDLPAEPGLAYVAGEARACQAVRRHLTRDRGWPRRAVIVKPFWAPGRRGLD